MIGDSTHETRNSICRIFRHTDFRLQNFRAETKRYLTSMNLGYVWRRNTNTYRRHTMEPVMSAISDPIHSLLLLLLIHRLLLLLTPLFCAWALTLAGGKGNKRVALVELVRLICESTPKMPATHRATSIAERLFGSKRRR